MSKQSSEVKKQSEFSSGLGFIIAAASAAVGIGNLWRFPAVALAGGGGTYLLCYLVAVVMVGYPILLAELALGRSNQQGVFESFAKQGAWKWLGLLFPVICFSIFCFYNVVAGWVIGYFWSLLNGNLGAVEVGKTSASFKIFFDALRANWQGNLIWTLIMILGAVFINKAGVSDGIEKCAKVLMPLFIIMLFGIIGYACLLPGASKGIYAYFMPSWKNFSPETIANALSQALMSLGIGMGAMVTYGAYVNKRENLYTSSSAIVLSDTLVAFAAGLFVFAFLGHTGFDFSKVKEIDPGLAFTTLPHGLLKNLSSLVANIILGIFFLLLAFAAITSSISMLEVATKYLESCFNIERNKAIYGVATASYLGGVICILADSNIEGLFSVMQNSTEYNFHNFFQDLVLGVLAPFSLFLFSLFTAYRWKVANVFQEVSDEKAPGKWLEMYINLTVKYLCPLFCGFTFVYSLFKLFA